MFVRVSNVVSKVYTVRSSGSVPRCKTQDSNGVHQSHAEGLKTANKMCVDGVDNSKIYALVSHLWGEKRNTIPDPKCDVSCFVLVSSGAVTLQENAAIIIHNLQPKTD